MALLKALCWALIFIIRIRFPPGTSLHTVYVQLNHEYSENSTLDLITLCISGLNSLTVGVFLDLVGDCSPKIIETLTG